MKYLLAILFLFVGLLVNENLKISLAVKNAFNTEYMGRPGDITTPEF